MPYKMPEELADEFAADWNAAMNPCVRCLIDRCHPDFRDELKEQLDTLLTTLPTPPYSPVQIRRGMEKVQPIVERATSRENLSFTLGGDDDPVRVAFLAKPWHARWSFLADYHLRKLWWRIEYRLIYPFKKKRWE